MKEVSSNSNTMEAIPPYTGYQETVQIYHAVGADITNRNCIGVNSSLMINFVDPFGKLVVSSWLSVELNPKDFVQVSYFEILTEEMNSRIKEFFNSHTGSKNINFSFKPLKVSEVRDAAISLRYE